MKLTRLCSTLGSLVLLANAPARATDFEETTDWSQSLSSPTLLGGSLGSGTHTVSGNVDHSTGDDADIFQIELVPGAALVDATVSFSNGMSVDDVDANWGIFFAASPQASIDGGASNQVTVTFFDLFAFPGFAPSDTVFGAAAGGVTFLSGLPGTAFSKYDYAFAFTVPEPGLGILQLAVLLTLMMLQRLVRAAAESWDVRRRK